MAKGFLLRSLSYTAVEYWASAPGTSAAYVANDFMGMVYAGAVADAPIGVRLDFGAPVIADTVGVLGVLCSATAGAVMVFAGNDPTMATNSFSADLSPVGEVRDGKGLHNIAAPIGAVGPYRYWLVRVAGPAGVAPMMARVLIGARYQPATNFSWGVGRGVNDLGEVSHSPRGATLRRRARKLRTLGLSWQFLTEAEAEGQALPLLEEVGNTEYVLACLNPDAHPQRSRRMYYGPLQGDLSLTWRAYDMFDKRLQIESVI